MNNNLPVPIKENRIVINKIEAGLKKAGQLTLDAGLSLAALSTLVAACVIPPVWIAAIPLLGYTEDKVIKDLDIWKSKKDLAFISKIVGPHTREISQDLFAVKIFSRLNKMDNREKQVLCSYKH